jgi:hypothetical protein
MRSLRFQAMDESLYQPAGDYSPLGVSLFRLHLEFEMEKNVYFSRGTLRSNRAHFAICPGGFIRLKPGNLPVGSIIVDGYCVGKNVVVDIHRVEANELVKVGRGYEPFKKSAIIDVVKETLLKMPAKMAVFATEMAWRAIMADKSTRRIDV